MERLTPNVTIAEQVADQLRRRITAGEFAIGDLIPTEAELTRELGVSRNSVREALRSLVHAGLLKSRAGYGTVVIANSDLAPALTRRIEQDRAADVAEVRTLFEREAARLAAVRATDEQRSALHEALEARERATNAAEYVAADLTFHRALLDASGNALLAELGRGTGGNEQALVHLDSPDIDHRAQMDPTLEALDALHTELATAIDAHDADQAADIAERLVRMAHTPAS
jgi:DNA-binding FadR family transcriptional regulator